MKTISREDFARLMAEAAYYMPTTKKGDTADFDQKSNDWMRASEVLASVGRPFASVTVDDDTLEDGYKVVPLRKLQDIPAVIAKVIIDASKELDTRFGKVVV